MSVPRNKSVDVHAFAMVPRADIPRSQFRMQKAYKTTLNSGYLIPFFAEEVLPGDSWKLRMSTFCRLATLISPYMDNAYFESFFFFVPNRLTWENWERFMGAQDNPDSSIDFLVPQVVSQAGGFEAGALSVYDYLGLPVQGQVVAPNTIEANALPLRAYYLIYNEWFRDQNLIDSLVVPVDDGPDAEADFTMQRRGKRHDYFTSCIPWPQKGGTSVPVPLSGDAPVFVDSTIVTGNSVAVTVEGTTTHRQIVSNTAGLGTTWGSQSVAGQTPQMYADLSQATAATINELRSAFQIQRLLERDARGGTRYAESILAHFGVRSPDARLQRPEYLGGGSTRINVHAVAQTSGTSVTGSDTPQANLSGFGTVVDSGHGFNQSFTEHGYIIGLMNVRADLTYQQGLRRHWSRRTRYDYYYPVFAHLGEQAVLSKEIYATGEAGDEDVFGYQERWAEYRYLPSEITGQFRSTDATPLDTWHLAQVFTARPVLNQEFIEETPPFDRVIAVPSEPEFLLDAFFDIVAARPMPMYSVPGLIDHF